MKIKLGIGVCCFFFSVNTAISQINYGTTGLMNLPTADMQRDKDFPGGRQLAEPPRHRASLVV